MGQDHSGGPGAKPVDAREARLRQQAIGVRLRQMFDEVVNEHVPDEFLAILQQADDRRPGPSKKNLMGRADEPAPVGRAVKTEP